LPRFVIFAALLVTACQQPAAEPLSKSERAAVVELPRRFTNGWLHNSSQEVMALFAPEAVFIPHDGVSPHIGRPAIHDFWFPTKGGAGKVTAFTMTVEGLGGDAHNAIVWGKSDLHWQNDKAAYHWPGYYLMSAEQRHGRWLVTHLVSSDEQPTSKPIASR
jgi:uncharacterized protein (TIGR02246 family)